MIRNLEEHHDGGEFPESFVGSFEGYDGHTRQSYTFGTTNLYLFISLHKTRSLVAPTTPPNSPRRQDPRAITFNIPAQVSRWSQLSITLTPQHQRFMEPVSPRTPQRTRVREPMPSSITHSAPSTPTGGRSARSGNARRQPALHLPSQPSAPSVTRSHRTPSHSSGSSSRNTRHGAAHAARYVIPPMPRITDPVYPVVNGFVHPLANEDGFTPHMGTGEYGYYGVTRGLQLGVFYDTW